MTEKLTWNQLLCTTRVRAKSETASNDSRNDFENDYDRVVFSSPFRRLQDKAQVFPLERNDFIRTRLTHSMEVAAIARSIGISVSNQLIEKGLVEREDNISDIPTILETAGLAHDIGNPPFGHFGEYTIGKSFEQWLEEHTYVTLTELEKKDLISFDGNCQMFRILTHLQCIRDEYGLNLTYATLASLMKYPFDSLQGNKNDEFCEKNGIYYKKYGYYYSESDIAHNVLAATGLIRNGVVYRHPLAFILEAADDIAYSAADLEDGFKKKLFSFDQIKSYFDPEEAEDNCIKEACEQVYNIINSENYYSGEKKLQMIRIVLQGLMINKVVDAFVENYHKIFNMEFKEELLLVSAAQGIRERLKKLSNDYIFNNVEIEKIELGGEQVIGYLVKRFMDSLGDINFIDYLITSDKNKISKSQKRMYDMISDDFRKVFSIKVDKLIKEGLCQEDLYNKIFYYICIMVIDYISGMTDGFCTDLYKKLQGIGNN